MNETNLLEVKNLETSFFTALGEVKAVRNISFEVRKSEVIGIVGESGSGKSVTSLSIMRLLRNPGKIIGGEVLFNGENLLLKSQKEMSKIRGNKIAMIFQDPMTSLDPVYPIGSQIFEILRQHKTLTRKEAKEESIKLLDMVGIPSPEKRYNSYPFECSGGMRQRVNISIAIACKPELIIADEPTTALDVTIQAQILELLRNLQKENHTSIIFITHNLGLISEMCSRVVVMYGGMVMEEGYVEDTFRHPLHPYTQGLMKAIPQITFGKKRLLIPIEGMPPDMLHPPAGCPFAPRCPYAKRICVEYMPPTLQEENSRKVACWLIYHEKYKQKILQRRNEQ